MGCDEKLKEKSLSMHCKLFLHLFAEGLQAYIHVFATHSNAKWSSNCLLMVSTYLVSKNSLKMIPSFKFLSVRQIQSSVYEHQLKRRSHVAEEDGAITWPTVGEWMGVGFGETSGPKECLLFMVIVWLWRLCLLRFQGFIKSNMGLCFVFEGLWGLLMVSINQVVQTKQTKLSATFVC